MKKGYMICIVGAVSLLISSAVIYNSRIQSKENYKKDSSILSGDIIEKKLDKEINIDETVNYFSQNLTIPNNLTSKISISNGFEELGSYEERMCYNKIKTGCEKILNTFSAAGYYVIAPIVIDNCKLSSEQIKKVLYALQNDSPEIFWIANSFSYMYDNKSTVVKLNSIFSKEEKEKSVEKLNKKVSEIISQIPYTYSDYEKELYIHDYIIDNCKYSKINPDLQKYNSLNKSRSYSSKNSYEAALKRSYYENRNIQAKNNLSSKIFSLREQSKVFTPYGCLIDKSAVCEGYSKAMQILLCAAGIKCRTVVGARGNEPHMWNMVLIGGNWYHLDVTWDGSGSLQRYNYFNIDDETVRADHIINPQLDSKTVWPSDKRCNFTLPTCNSKKENYFHKNAVKVASIDSYAIDKITNSLISLALNKNRYLYIMCDKNFGLENLKKQLFSAASNKLFACINKANKRLNKESNIDSSRIEYSECKPQNVIMVKINYI